MLLRSDRVRGQVGVGNQRGGALSRAAPSSSPAHAPCSLYLHRFEQGNEPPANSSSTVSAVRCEIAECDSKALQTHRRGAVE